jgi:hypothetical protein
MQGMMNRYPDVLTADQIAELSYQMADAMMHKPDGGIAAIRRGYRG